MGRKYLKVLGGFLICICLVFIFRESILSAYARWFEVSNAEKGADAIICLSGGKLTRVQVQLSTQRSYLLKIKNLVRICLS